MFETWSRELFGSRVADPGLEECLDNVEVYQVRIFLCHSSRVKPLVREVRGFLPEHVNAWIDEKDLIAGDPLERKIRNAIQVDTDFLVVFLDENAARSEWVQKELLWAREQELTLGRPFILPILIDDGDMGELNWLKERLCLKCHGYKEADISRLASELSSALFAWLSRDLERLRRPTEQKQSDFSILDQADKLLQQAAHHIRTAVFPYQKSNPLKLVNLYDQLTASGRVPVSSPNELQELLFRLRQRKLLSGIVISSGNIYVEEEHLSWRLQEAVAAKQAMADHVSEWITDGNCIYLDAGSTTIHICHNICRGVRFRQWARLTVVTNSIPAADELVAVASELGLEDGSPALQLYIVGGRTRMNTSAIVRLNSGTTDIVELSQFLGGFDIAFVGTNGVYWPQGCTTAATSEAEGKHQALSNGRRRVIMADSSKYNLRQDEVFASFDLGLEIVTAADENRSLVESFSESLRSTPSKIILVD